MTALITDSNLDIPDFLRFQNDERTDAWKTRRLRWTRDMKFDDVRGAYQADPGTEIVRAAVEATDRARRERVLNKKRDAETLRKRHIKNERIIRLAAAGAIAMQPRPVKIVRVIDLNQQGLAPTTQETDMSKTNAKTTPKADQVKGLRERRAEARDRLQGALGRPLTGKKNPKAPAKAAGKKAAKAKARTPAVSKPAGGTPKAIRPGSKLEIVVGLLTRKEGCTSAEVLAATEWPAVSMPQQARAAGLTLRQEKDGKVTRYWGS